DEVWDVFVGLQAYRSRHAYDHHNVTTDGAQGVLQNIAVELMRTLEDKIVNDIWDDEDCLRSSATEDSHPGVGDLIRGSTHNYMVMGVDAMKGKLTTTIEDATQHPSPSTVRFAEIYRKPNGGWHLTREGEGE